MERVVVSRLLTPEGEIYKNQVVEIDCENETVHFYDFTEELAHTRWQGGSYVLEGCKLLPIDS